VVLIYLVVVVLFFVLWSHESPIVPAWLIAEYGFEKAVEIAAALASNNIVD
jgi:hypothetical protein